MVLSPDGMEKAQPEEITPIARASKTIKIMPLQPVTADGKADAKPSPGPEMPAASDASADTVPARERTSAAIDVGAEAIGAVVPPVKPEDKNMPDEATATKAPGKEPAAPADMGMKLDPPDEPASPEAHAEEAAAAAAPIPAAQTSVPDDERDIDDTDGQLAPNQAVDQSKRKEDDAKLTRLAEEEKLIASKQFYLPISGVEKQRRSLDRFVLVFVLVLFLALVWLDIVLDAGILKIGGIQPLTHFFHP